MPTRKVIKSVLENFLGTLTSRYSGWSGYWLFGFIVNDLDRLDHDLLIRNAGAPRDTPIAHLRSLATTKFLEQLSKAGLDPILIRKATLSIERSPESVEVRSYHHSAAGYRLRFIAGAITDLGKAYERERIIYVWPHDWTHEYRSARAPW
jgi:hypothetical protein